MARRNQAEIVLTAQDRTKRAFTQVNQKLGRFATVGLAAAAAGIALLTRQGLQQIDALAKQSRLLGITTEKLAAFKLVAAKTGIEQKTLEKSLINVTRVVAEAAEGTGLATDTLKKLGLEAVALSRTSPDEQFLQIAEAMKGLNTQSEKVLAAYELFGGRGAALLRTLEAGAAGFEEAEEKTKRFGTAISAVDAASIEEANDAFTDLQESVKGLSFDLARRFAPGMKDANEGLTNFVVTLRRDFIPAMALLFEQLGLVENDVRGLSGIELAVRVEVQLDEIADLEDVLEKIRKIARQGIIIANVGSPFVGIIKREEALLLREKEAAEARLVEVQVEQDRRAQVILAAEKKIADMKAAQTEEARIKAQEIEQTADAERLLMRIKNEEQANKDFIRLQLDRAKELKKILADEAREQRVALNAQRKLEERAAQQTIQLRQATAQASIQILQVLVGKNKTVARALFLVEKGLAIARVIQNTAAASMKALADLGPIAGPPAAAAIIAFGAAQAGLIAATALTGVGGVGGGGGLGGLGGGGGFGTGDFSGSDAANDPAPDSGGAAVQQQGVVQLIFPNLFGITPDAIDALADALREASENRDVIIVSGQGRNAELLAGVNG